MSTIAAISTALGIGGIGIVRMSGKECFNILNKIFIAKNPQEIDEINGYSIKYGKIIDPITTRVIDEVLVSYFKEPKSYTTENMCEISSHGGSIVVKNILEICLKNGAILAEPGEFTKKAFLNGRMDLTQVEAVIDVINAKTDKELKASVNQLEGSLSRSIINIKKEILDLLVEIEVSIDYPEYDIPEVTEEKVKEKLDKIEDLIKKLYNSYDNGKILKEGISVAIIGRPNSGKSSLLNTILKEERAIVTSIEGTTRDTIEEFVNINGIPFKFIDTAGIRDADNEVEIIGINKSKKVAEESDLIIAMFDNSKELLKEDEEILDFIKNKRSIILLNKIDLKESNLEKNKKVLENGKKIIKISLARESDLSDLYKELDIMFGLEQICVDNEVIVTNIRHKETISNALNSLYQAKESLRNKMPVDIIAINIKEIMEELGKITGDNVSEDIIKEIFSKFCLGK